MANSAVQDASDIPNDSMMTDVDDRVTEFLQGLPEDVRARVTELQRLQAERDELESKFREELLALEKKYDKLYEPFYTKRGTIVAGDGAKSGGDEATNGIPNFWLTVLKNHGEVGRRITDRDEEALKFLQDVRWSRLDEENEHSFKLEWVFATNPFFSNKVLTKTYHMDEDDGEAVLEKAVGTVIEWKQGHNLCIATKSTRGRKSQRREEEDTKPAVNGPDGEAICDSFFMFFSPPEVPANEDDLDEMELAELHEDLEDHCDLAVTIREQIIPHAVSWFTGEAVEDEEDEDDDDDDADEEEEGGEELNA